MGTTGDLGRVLGGRGRARVCDTAWGDKVEYGQLMRGRACDRTLGR